MDATASTTPRVPARRRSRYQRLMDDSSKLNQDHERRIAAFAPKEQKYSQTYLQRRRKLDEQLALEQIRQQGKRKRRSNTAARGTDIGFTKPYLIDDAELLAFVGLSKPSQVRQPTVTSAFWKYVKENNVARGEPVADEKTGKQVRGVVTDATLAHVLNVAPGTLVYQKKVQRLITDSLAAKQTVA